MYPRQSTAVPVTQAPAPSQTCPVTRPVLTSHEGVPEQTSLAAYFWHAPAPSQTPFVPHDGCPMSMHIVRGLVPTAAGKQVPGVAEQVKQAPTQAWSQQTPSAQKVL
jgi:hypothetical protein